MGHKTQLFKLISFICRESCFFMYSRKSSATTQQFVNSNKGNVYFKTQNLKIEFYVVEDFNLRLSGGERP